MDSSVENRGNRSLKKKKSSSFWNLDYVIVRNLILSWCIQVTLDMEIDYIIQTKINFQEAL